MSLFTTLASLSQTAASNAADGSADPPSTIDNQLNLLASFVAQLRDGNGFTAQLGTRNRIINGNFAVNQRAVSGTVTLAAGAYGHDRWKGGAAGCTYTYTTSGLDTTINVSAGSLQQVIEGNNIEGGTYCMSWAGSAQGKINGGAYSASGVNATGVSAGANLTVELGTGTFTKVQVEPGATASTFERRNYGAEEALCKRYYQTSYRGVPPGTISQDGRMITPSNGSYATFPIQLFPVMRAIPTVAIYSPGAGTSGQIYDETSGSPFTPIGFGSPFVSANFLSYQTSTSPPANHCMTLHYTASAEL